VVSGRNMATSPEGAFPLGSEEFSSDERPIHRRRIEVMTAPGADLVDAPRDGHEPPTRSRNFFARVICDE